MYIFSQYPFPEWVLKHEAAQTNKNNVYTNSFLKRYVKGIYLNEYRLICIISYAKANLEEYIIKGINSKSTVHDIGLCNDPKNSESSKYTHSTLPT